MAYLNPLQQWQAANLMSQGHLTAVMNQGQANHNSLLDGLLSQLGNATNLSQQQLAQMQGMGVFGNAANVHRAQAQAAMPPWRDMLSMMNAAAPASAPKHSARELTAFALAWAFGDEALAALLTAKDASATGDLRAPSRLDALRLDDTQPTRAQIANAWVQRVAWNPRVLGAMAVAALFDAHCWHLFGLP